MAQIPFDSMQSLTPSEALTLALFAFLALLTLAGIAGAVNYFTL